MKKIKSWMRKNKTIVLVIALFGGYMYLKNKPNLY